MEGLLMGGVTAQVNSWISADLNHWGDSDLVAESLGGNSAAWEALIMRYRRLIYSIPIKVGLSDSDAADVFQFVCLRLFEKLSSLRNRGRVGPWLLTTATRESWRVAACRRRERYDLDMGEEYDLGYLSEIPTTEIPADERMASVEQQQILREAVESLPKREKNLIDLLFYQKDKLSYKEIARRMNMPVSSVGPTRARCLEKLKVIIEDRI